MQARYYDPVGARFLSIDPVTFAADGRTGMFNRYSYTLNDPVNMVDTTGQAAQAVLRASARPISKEMAKRGIAGSGIVVAVASIPTLPHEHMHVMAEIGKSYLNDNVSESDKPKVRGSNVRPTDEPVDQPEQLAGEEILGELEAGGGENISGQMGDKERYGETGTHDKVRGSHKHPDGTVTEVHGDRNRTTGEMSDTKFKDPPDNNKSRSTQYQD